MLLLSICIYLITRRLFLHIFFVHLDFLFSQLPFTHFKNCYTLFFLFVGVLYTFKHIPLLSVAGGFQSLFFFPNVPLV